MGIKLIIGLILILAIFRLMGKKELAEVTPLDMAFIVIIADLVPEISADVDLNPLHLIFALGLWTGLIYILEYFKRKSKKFKRIVDGKPVLVIEDGVIYEDTLETLRLTEDELDMLLRMNGIFDVKKVKKAYLEISGTLSIKKQDK